MQTETIAIAAPTRSADGSALDAAPGRPLARPRIDGKFLAAGGETFYVLGVTYGPFAAADADGEFDPVTAAADLAAMRARGINSIRVYSVPPRWLLDAAAWRVSDALALSRDIHGYRDFIARSRAEFTVAKDQNVRLRSGWFSDRSACYLAAGRPVVMQDTGFGDVLPTGAGLFAFRDIRDAVAAVETIEANYEAHAGAAREIAREFFGSDYVLASVLRQVGVA
jgi:hypothetical protein